MSNLIVPFQFRMPVAQLHPYLKEAVQDLERHGFCILDHELVVERGVVTSAQLELFREACRKVSIEKDRDLVMGEISNLSEGALQYLAARTEAAYTAQDFAGLLDRANAPGTVNSEEYAEDPDGKGLLEETGQEMPVKAE